MMEFTLIGNLASPSSLFLVLLAEIFTPPLSTNALIFIRLGFDRFTSYGSFVLETHPLPLSSNETRGDLLPQNQSIMIRFKLTSTLV
jgi:hypothetical protein